jgi:transmembrane sensor
MTDWEDLDSNDAVLDQAIAWLVRVQSDAATDADRAALLRWLEDSEAHQDAFDEAELLAAELGDSADEIRSALSAPAPRSRIAPARRPSGLRWFIPLALAAGVAGAAILGPMAWRAYDGVPMAYRTAPGETRTVSLADGTRVQLDAASSMTVRLGWRTRRVELGDAEASFDVAHDPHRPFVVDVGDQAVRVVGTEFNIRHYGPTVVITVRRGVVEVSQPGLGPSPIARLGVGEELTHNQGSPRSSVAEVDPNAAFAWTQGRLICDHQPLAEIVAYLNRRYPIPIRLSDAAARRRFSGVLELGDEATLVRHLAAYLSLSIDRDDQSITLR